MVQESEAVAASKPTIVEQPPLSSVSVKRQVGCSEDYLLSKLPLDGQEVPFVVPPFRMAYVQPKNLPSISHAGGIKGKAQTVLLKLLFSFCCTLMLLSIPTENMFAELC